MEDIFYKSGRNLIICAPNFFKPERKQIYISEHSLYGSHQIHKELKLVCYTPIPLFLNYAKVSALHRDILHLLYNFLSNMCHAVISALLQLTWEEAGGLDLN